MKFVDFFIFIVIFMSLFGPKVGGVIDLSVLGGLFGLVLIIFLKKVIISREYIVVVIFVAAVALYSILIVLVNGTGETQPILRNFRALISTVLLGLVFYNLAINSVLSSAKLTNILIVALLVNAIVIIVSIYIPDIKSHLAGLYGFNKTFVGLRSFGLTSGYDTAGYLCTIGAIFSFVAAYYKTTVRYSLIALFFIAAVFFTSRSSMMLAIMLITGVCAVFILKGRWSHKIISVGYIAVGVSVAIYYLAPLILSTFFFQTSNVDYTSNYAATDLSSWYEAMWILPEDTVSILIGSGKVVQISDLGYVEIIYMIGVLGLLLVSLIYMYMFSVIKVLNHSARCGYSQIDDGGRVLVLSLMMIILLMYIINFKNLYFLARGFHELIVILFFFILGLPKRRVSERGYFVRDKN